MMTKVSLYQSRTNRKQFSIQHLSTMTSLTVKTIQKLSLQAMKNLMETWMENSMTTWTKSTTNNLRTSNQAHWIDQTRMMRKIITKIMFNHLLYNESARQTFVLLSFKTTPVSLNWIFFRAIKFAWKLSAPSLYLITLNTSIYQSVRWFPTAFQRRGSEQSKENIKNTSVEHGTRRWRVESSFCIVSISKTLVKIKPFQA